MSWQARVDNDERETAGLWGQLVLRMKWWGAGERPRRGRGVPKPVTPGIAAQYAAETE
jgi:hypothetical protein